MRVAINFHDLALERGRQSNRSSPESLFAKSFQKPDPDQQPFFGNTMEPKEAWPLKRPRKAWNW